MFFDCGFRSGDCGGKTEFTISRYFRLLYVVDEMDMLRAFQGIAGASALLNQMANLVIQEGLCPR